MKLKPMGVKSLTTVGDAKAEMQPLFDKHALWNYPAFIEWRKEIEKECDELKDAGIVIPIGDDNNAARALMLQMLGLGSPKTHEESMLIYLSLKSVLSFWKRKLGQLESQSDRYEELEKKIHAAG